MDAVMQSFLFFSSDATSRADQGYYVKAVRDASQLLERMLQHRYLYLALRIVDAKSSR